MRHRFLSLGKDTCLFQDETPARGMASQYVTDFPKNRRRYEHQLREIEVWFLEVEHKN
jgi:hypothetical protein